MHLAEIFAGVNWLAVLGATVAAFMLGGLWYSKVLFANAWMQEVGLTEEAINNAQTAKTFISTFVLQIVACTALAVFIGADSDWREGLHTGLTVGLLWIATAYAITYLFEQRSLRLWLINAGYYVVLFAISGTIIGTLQ